MHRFLTLLSVLLLTACVGNSPRLTEIARHDLGDPEGRWSVPGISVMRVDVRVAAWLDTPAQWYRLSYADPLRRHSYAENRWAAPPGELLERWLQRHILSGPVESAVPGCRLVLWLDELEQRFVTSRTSEVILDVRASLQPLRGERVAAKQDFHVVMPAATPDARGGVQAARAAANALAHELAKWLGDLVRERPQAITICMENKEK